MSENKEKEVFDHVIIKVTNKSEKDQKNVNLIDLKFEKSKDLVYESLTNAKYEDFLEDIQEGEYCYPHKISKIKIESNFLDELKDEEVEAFLLYNVNKSAEEKYNFPFAMKRNVMESRRDVIEFETIMSFTPSSNIIFSKIPAKSSIIIHLYN